MKALKKAMSVLVSLLMIFTFALPAFADEVQHTVTVTVDTDEILNGHTFEAYQVFSGEQTEDKTLTDVVWGSGINGDDFLAALKAADPTNFGTCATAADVAKQLGTMSSADAEAVAKLALANKKEGTGTPLAAGANTLAVGYYLIVDTTDTDGEDAARNAALLQVTDDIRIKAKTDKPSVEKKVLENTKYDLDESYGKKYNDVADYNIGDMVPFKLIGTVPDMSHYTTYKYVFHDTLSDGLTAPAADAIKVYVSDDKAGTAMTEITGDVVEKTVSGQTITVSFKDLKSVEGVAKGKYILVEYEAQLNAGAAIGLPGNPNEVYLNYSNNPDESGVGDEAKGETPVDKVIVFTYELDTTKIDGADKDKKLPNAEFKLRNAAGKYATVDVNGKVTGWVDNEADGTTLKSDVNGLFKVVGLDDGTYFLKETKAPAGYNTLGDEIEIEVKATTANGQNWTSGKPSEALTALEVKVDNGAAAAGDTANGTVAVTVENHKGAVLPGTGGIGTTIFYVVGGLLMFGAAVLLITKKRMGSDK